MIYCVFVVGHVVRSYTSCVNEREWSDGQCSHGPLTPLEEGKEYLPKESKSAQAMREVIYDPQWLNTLKFYVYFR